MKEVSGHRWQMVPSKFCFLIITWCVLDRAVKTAKYLIADDVTLGQWGLGLYIKAAFLTGEYLTRAEEPPRSQRPWDIWKESATSYADSLRGSRVGEWFGGLRKRGSGEE